MSPCEAGGFVTAEGRVDGNLNLSRALGDFAYKKDTSRKAVEQKISAEAEVKTEVLGREDKFLAIGRGTQKGSSNVQFGHRLRRLDVVSTCFDYVKDLVI